MEKFPINDKEYKVEVKRVQRLIRPWFEAMGLHNWKIKLDVVREQLNDEYCPGTEGMRMVAKTGAYWQYYDAMVLVSALESALLDDATLEEYLLHEVLHIVLSELEVPDERLEHEEHVCSLMAYRILKLKNRK